MGEMTDGLHESILLGDAHHVSSVQQTFLAGDEHPGFSAVQGDGTDNGGVPQGFGFGREMWGPACLYITLVLVHVLRPALEPRI